VGNAVSGQSDPSGLWSWREYVDAFRRSYADHVNPWDGTDSVPVDGIDHFLHYGTMAGQGTAAAAGAAAGGVYVYTAVTGATVTVGAAASALATEVADTLAEEALSAATGHDVIIPVSFVDVAQDLGRLAARKGAQSALQDSVMRSMSDPLRKTMGPARVNHVDEYNSILADLDKHGVPVTWHTNSLSYGPSAKPGEVGNIVFDPDASISAMRHEYGHFLDDLEEGLPGFTYYFKNTDRWIATERRQYLDEIRTAKRLGDSEAREQLIKNYVEERRQIVDRYGGQK
jgi:hypothetical protein